MTSVLMGIIYCTFFWCKTLSSSCAETVVKRGVETVCILISSFAAGIVGNTNRSLFDSCRHGRRGIRCASLSETLLRREEDGKICDNEGHDWRPLACCIHCETSVCWVFCRLKRCTYQPWPQKSSPECSRSSWSPRSRRASSGR